MGDARLTLPRPGSAASRLAWVAALLAALAVLLRYELVGCPVAAIFSIPCPGCGLTRAALRLLAFDLEGALGLHPLSPLLVPLLVLLAARAAHRYVRTGQAGAAAEGALGRAAASLLLALLLAVWVLRFFGAWGGPVPVRSLRQQLDAAASHGAVRGPC